MTPSSQRSPVGAAPEPLLPVTLTVNGEPREVEQGTTGTDLFGGDKAVPYVEDRGEREENPAMGWRALRLALERVADFYRLPG